MGIRLRAQVRIMERRDFLLLAEFGEYCVKWEYVDNPGRLATWLAHSPSTLP